MIRAFFGIPIDQSVIARLSQDAKSVCGEIEEPEIRWINFELLHITVKFFAEIEPEALVTVSKAAAQMISKIKVFNLTVRKISPFPLANSNTLAAHIKPHQTLRNIHKLLDKAGEKLGLRAETRRYRPHITLAKCHSNGYYTDTKSYSDLILPVRELVLYESKPAARGSTYIPLRRFKLLE